MGDAREPLASALCRAAWRIMRISSKIVTMSDPNAIEPRERVEAFPNADIVGCLGYVNSSHELIRDDAKSK